MSISRIRLQFTERPGVVHRPVAVSVTACCLTRDETRMAANIAKLPELAERYCGQLQSYQYQPLVQYAKLKAFCSAIAARSSASYPIVIARQLEKR